MLSPNKAQSLVEEWHTEWPNSGKSGKGTGVWGGGGLMAQKLLWHQRDRHHWQRSGGG